MPFGLTPEFVLSVVPASAIALLLANRAIELARNSRYGSALTEALRALNDGKITAEEYQAIKDKL